MTGTLIDITDRLPKRDRSAKINRGCNFVLDAITEMRRAELDSDDIFYALIHCARDVQPRNGGAA